MNSHARSAAEIQAEFELLKRRQVALRICMALFDAITDMQLLVTIGEYLDASSRAPDIASVDSIIDELKKLSATHNVPLPLGL